MWNRTTMGLIGNVRSSAFILRIWLRFLCAAKKKVKDTSKAKAKPRAPPPPVVAPSMGLQTNRRNGYRHIRLPLDHRRPDIPSPEIFDRHATLSGAQIINYRVTPDEKWLVLIGISGNTTNPSAFKVKGAMQLYSRDRGVSQPIEGHAAAFAEISQEGHQKPTKLFTFSVRTANGAKVCLLQLCHFSNCHKRRFCFQLHVVEIDHTAPDPPFVKKAVDVYFSTRSNERLPSGHASIEQARNHLPRNKIRLYSSLRLESALVCT